MEVAICRKVVYIQVNCFGFIYFLLQWDELSAATIFPVDTYGQAYTFGQPVNYKN